MPAKKPESQINLLPQKGFGSTTTGRILAWILSTFRIIVIVTEIIVMVAFLSRFWLDAKNTDLAEEIQQKQAVLAASIEFDKQFKDTQERIKVYAAATQNPEKLTKYMTTIKSFLPPDVILTTISFVEGKISIEGFSPNEVSIGQLQTNLASTGLFNNLSISEIRTSLKDPQFLQFILDASERSKQ